MLGSFFTENESLRCCVSWTFNAIAGQVPFKILTHNSILKLGDQGGYDILIVEKSPENILQLFGQ
jgi:hypothetical protein